MKFFPTGPGGRSKANFNVNGTRIPVNDYVAEHAVCRGS